MASSLLHAVVEAPGSIPPFIVDERESRSPFVRLFGATPPSEVGVVVALLATYGQDSTVENLEQLTRDFPTVTPGGLAAIDDLQCIWPSCCCGLEAWREWLGLLDGGASLWLGHDPSPWVEVVDGQFLVWPDGGLGRAPPATVTPVRFSFADLRFALTQVEEDLRAFLVPLGAWATQHGASEKLTLELRKSFVDTFIECTRVQTEAP